MFARLLDVQIEIQSGLFNATYVIADDGLISTIQLELCRVSLTATSPTKTSWTSLPKARCLIKQADFG
jgi:hypothetical protein